VARIFLCHASEDKAQVREVYHRLRAIDGFEPWLDEEDLLPGQEWARKIRRALQTSDFILIFLSRNSVATRGYVQWEMKLALAVDNSAYIGQEMREMRFRTLPPTQAQGIDTAHATSECAHAFANGHPPPPQFACGALLPTRPQFFDGPCHKQATGTALERLGSFDQQCLERVGQFHWQPSSMRVPGV
jgi:hypothetical protein